MKAIYKIILFFAFFQMSIVIINLMNVFPNESTLYSDVEIKDLLAFDDPLDFLTYFFSVPQLPGLGAFTQFTFAMLVFMFLIAGAAIARATQSWTPIVVVIIATSFVPMITKSLKFFNKIFYNWDSPALVYLALTLGVGLILIALFTIVETPTHGKGG